MSWKEFLTEKILILMVVLYFFLLYRYRRRIKGSNFVMNISLKMENLKKALRLWNIKLDRKKMVFKTAILVLLIFICYAAYARLSPEKRFNRLVDRCNVLMNDKKYEQAIIDMRNALKIRPNYARGHYFLAHIYRNRGEIDKAESELQQIVQLQANYENSVEMLSSILTAKRDSVGLKELAKKISGATPVYSRILEAQGRMMEKDFKKAEFFLKEAMQMAPENNKIYQVMGDLQVSTGQYKKAIDSYKKALRLNFGLWQVHYALGKLYLDEGNLEDGLWELKVVRSLNKDFSLPALTLAQIYLKKGEQEKAGKILEDILEEDETHEKASYMLGIVYMGMGKFQDAINLWAQLPPEYRTKKEYLYNLAFAHYRTKKYHKAKKWLDSLEKIEDFDVASLRLLARVQFALGELDATAEIMQSLVRKNKANDEDRKLLTLAMKKKAAVRVARAKRDLKELKAIRSRYADLEEYLRQRDYTSLIMGARKAIKENSFNAPFYNLLGVAYLATRRPELAKKYFRLSYDEKKQNPRPLLNLVKVYINEGNPKDAVELLLAHNNLFPKDPYTRLELGKIYLKTGKLGRAKGFFRQVIKLNPQDFEAHQQLAVIFRLKGDLEAAMAEYHKSISLNPQDTISLNDLAFIYSNKKENLDKAFEYANRAAKILPKKGEILDTLGWVYYQRSEFR